MTSEKYFRKEDLLKPDNMIMLYARGAFPMADKNGEINWYLPDIRSIIPLNQFNVPRSLRNFMETADFKYSYDQNVKAVIENCADRKETWISSELVDAYTGLIEKGHVHSVEVYQNEDLVGGLYGITFRGAFFGESMFSKVEQSSKCALVKLVERLRRNKFKVLDVQFINPHLEMFGAVEIPFEEFQHMLMQAYAYNPTFK